MPLKLSDMVLMRINKNIGLSLTHGVQDGEKMVSSESTTVKSESMMQSMHAHQETYLRLNSSSDFND